MLVSMVRYQLVANQLTQTLRKSNEGTGVVVPQSYLDALGLQIQNIGHQLPQELASNG